MWEGTLRDSYHNRFEMFESYSDLHGIAQRLGFESNKEAWNANPKIQVSSDPRDFKITEIQFGSATLRPISGTIEGPDGTEHSVESLEATQIGDEFWPKGLQPNDFAQAREFYYDRIPTESL